MGVGLETSRGEGRRGSGWPPSGGELTGADSDQSRWSPVPRSRSPAAHDAGLAELEKDAAATGRGGGGRVDETDRAAPKMQEIT